MKQVFDTIVVGAGFTGLTAAYELATRGHSVCVLESDISPGGLAGTFQFADGVRLERFYHHWFNNDHHVPDLARQLGMEGDIVRLPSRTGMYFNSRHWKLSSPLDLLRFSALPMTDRIRLGMLVFRVRKVVDWKEIEHLSIREWLEPLCGERVYKTVWEPLIRSKFSTYADQVNAVWMWKKLVLRGSTRNAKGAEELAYFKGGFGRLAEAMAAAIERAGGKIVYSTRVTKARATTDRIDCLLSDREEEFRARSYLFTPALPIIANILSEGAPRTWLQSMRRVRYLGNICLVLRLKRSLSETYWLNVNDPGFPFVGVIEHTNFDPPKNYRDTHIVYLSRYLPTDDRAWNYTDEEYLDFALPHLRRMFPDFDPDWIIEFKIWRAEYAQPVTERNYSNYVPGLETPFENALISTMANIYPEDRGTNYAIREGREVAARMDRILQSF